MAIIITMHLFITKNSESNEETIFKLKKISLCCHIDYWPYRKRLNLWSWGTNFTILVYWTFHTVHNFNTLISQSAFIVIHWICLFWYQNWKSSASNEDYPIILKKILIWIEHILLTKALSKFDLIEHNFIN